ncbi:hypothetical protein QQS21_008211 [Conoideocrella luteorostrata]|uniref:Uncharacterized protein n=1 Tax=Conoideocrella luteorostrata TaxID=1105319 RepID=A0AAJ0CK41_9HYPO|nr:hypothetical protein QQS21_008211 [Conoideocrella luteorostrata]
MFSSLATKIALKKVGLPSNALDFSSSSEPNKLRKNPPSHDDDTRGSWLSYKSLPLTVHPWFSPAPPPVALGRVPRIGEVAPLDRDRRLQIGVAQKTFLSLRALANRYRGQITFIAVSHSSEQATRKWIDLLGGAWNVEVIIDEDRAVYAAWGLGTANMWHLFNPTTQMQGWKEKGWLGEKVAESIQRRAAVQSNVANKTKSPYEDEEVASTVLGNKWQESGAFAVDGRGTVIWGGKALRADDVMDLEEGAKLLGL